MGGLLDFLRGLLPYLLPVLLLVGKQLKAVPFVQNRLIPVLLVALNVGRLWVIRFGWAAPNLGGEGQPLEGAALFALPVFGLIGILGISGILVNVLGFGAQLAVDHFLVNQTHKGLKYRALFKLAQKTGLVQDGSATTLKAQVKW